jgi:sugar lactone lactonase YvrE
MSGHSSIIAADTCVSVTRSAPWWGLVVGCLAIGACDQSPVVAVTAPDELISASRNVADLTVASVLHYTSDDFSEGLAFSKQGDLYVGFGFTGDIVKVSRTGEVSLFSNIDPNDNSITLGLAVGPTGIVYAAVWSEDEKTNGVWKVEPDGRASRFAAMPLGTIPNFILIEDNGDLLITDTSEPGAVWRAKANTGAASVWVETDLLAPFPGANGMARYGNNVFVLNYGRGRIVTIPILPNGSAGTPSLFLEDERLVSADGITFDVRGNMYIGRNSPSSLLRVSPQGVIETLVDFPETLPTATNVAFGHGEERKTAYVTIGDVGGAANVVKVDIGIPGLPIQ